MSFTGRNAPRVIFYGSEKAMKGWRKVVRNRIKNVKCSLVSEVPPSDQYGRGFCFTAFIDELDCNELMQDWYGIQEGQPLQWNHRIFFKKSWEK
jgi:hypothetical protein